MRDVVVCHTTRLDVLSGAGDWLVVGVVIIRLWVFEDDVPCVDEAGDVTEAAKG